ncbi:MAG: PspC domain-containing protein [Pseudomonadota bacterium]
MTRNKRTLQLDKVNAKWLGVCAGVANFLEVEAWTVRLVFLGSCFFGGWFLIPLYFIAWYLLDEKSGELKDAIMENQAVRHFRTVDYRKKLYRNTRDGKVFGVCAGIADYLEVSAFAVRLTFILLTVLTGFPILFYVGALMVLEKKPMGEYQYEARSRTWTTQFSRDPESEPETPRQARTAGAAGPSAGASTGPRQFNESRRSESKQARDHFSKRREFQYCARKFAALQQRLARLEAYVTSNRFKLHREFKNMS